MIAKQNTTKKSAFADLVRLISLHDGRIDTLSRTLTQVTKSVNVSLLSPHQINCNKYEIHKS